MWQTVKRSDAAALAPAGYATQADYSGLAPGPLAVARLRFPLGATPWAELAARGAMLVPSLDHALALVWSAGGSGGVGVSF